MSKLRSELARFLVWYDGLGDEGKGIVADQLRDKFRGKKPQTSRRQTKKAVIIPFDSGIKGV